MTDLPAQQPRILIAGMGNVLHGDDGFGIRVVQELATHQLPGHVVLLEAGIAGIHLVQTLFDGYEMLLLVDAGLQDKKPGTLFLLRPEVPDLTDYTPDERRAIVADTHVTVPARAFVMARSLGVLPAHLYMLGCQPASYELGIGLSAPVRAAVPDAVEKILDILETFEVPLTETRKVHP